MQADRIEAAEDVFWVLPENWDALLLLAACTGCWRYGPDGKPCGFDYASADRVASWQATPASTLARLPLAVNAILQGK